jgi:serine/threonine protein kinase
MLYEMLAGRPPFRGDNAFAVMDQHLNARPTPPSRHASGIPSGLDGIVLKAIRKDPAERYQSATDLLRDLDRYQSLNLADFNLGEEKTVEPNHPNRALALVIASLAAGFLGVSALIVALSYLLGHH